MEDDCQIAQEFGSLELVVITHPPNHTAAPGTLRAPVRRRAVRRLAVLNWYSFHAATRR